MSAPIVELSRLLAELRPSLQPGCWAWCSLPPDAPVPEQALASLREAEGLSVVIDEAQAVARGWPIQFRSAWILLEVHSALQAVGLTAAVSAALSAAGIACNVIAGVHHDHLFVPQADAPAALAVLQRLS